MLDVVIIGGGFSGICSAIKLKEKGINHFLILERDAELGGTWWKNNYPGAAVDVPSRLYSFSFEKFDWTRLYAKQKEILSYTKGIIAKHQLAQKTKFRSIIKSLVYSETTASWEIKLEEQESLFSKFIINATGSLSQPSIPKIKGLENYKGAFCHTSSWNSHLDINSKKIAVIGTGASAVQLIPELAKKAKQVFVLQRAPHWILPRTDRVLKKWERNLLKVSFFNKLFRGFTFLKNEVRALFFLKLPSLSKLVQIEALHHLKKQVKDEKLRKELTPNYAIGCKRILLTNDYYPALTKKNVQLITTPIQEITTAGIRLKNEQVIEIDLLVFATGFLAAENKLPFQVIGKNKLHLKNYWKNGAEAYYGTTIPNFPNLFLTMGPNTGVGHTSVIYFIECQMNYIISALKKALDQNWQSIEIKEDVHKKYNCEIQNQLQKTIWTKGGCKSWYLNKDGKNTTLYPNFSFIYHWKTRKFDEEKHHIIR